MIQGGAPQNNSPSVDTVIGEFAANGYTYNTLAHDRGVISMARTPVMDSATSQFFICNADYPSLDGQYAAFGRVVVGMDVVDAITDHGMQYTSHSLNGMIYDGTKQPVIESAEIIDKR
jgi:peptidyl-prolyl cis-trans isomerase B (cyclophilin B)